MGRINTQELINVLTDPAIDKNYVITSTLRMIEELNSSRSIWEDFYDILIGRVCDVIETLDYEKNNEKPFFDYKNLAAEED